MKAIRNSNGQFANGSKHLFKHGLARTKIYNIWAGMVRRCNLPSEPAYRNYGARGIKVCERWQSFENFYADMGERPDKLSLDRIDNDGDYSPKNCRWADRRTQASNRRATKRYEVNGEVLTLSDWALRVGLAAHTISARIAKGWAPADAILTPKVTKRQGCPRGQSIRDYEYGARHSVIWSEPAERRAA